MENNSERQSKSGQISLDRRAIMKQASATGAIMAGATFGSTLAEGSNGQYEGEVVQKNEPFLECFVSVPAPDDGLIVAGTKRFPAFIKAPEGIYIPENASSIHSPSSAGMLIATPHGLTRVSENEPVNQGPMSVEEVSSSRSRKLQSSEINPAVYLDTNHKNAVYLKFGAANYKLKNGSSISDTKNVKLRFLSENGYKSVETVARINARYYGKTNLYSHTNLTTIPKNTPGGQHIQEKIEPKMKENGQVGNWKSVKHLQSINAIGIRQVNGGEPNG